jgi:hypothetical protein
LTRATHAGSIERYDDDDDDEDDDDERRTR